MAERFQLDTDFLVYALSVRGAERSRLQDMAASDAVVEISAIAWYEFCRGPRTPEQIAVARSFFGESGIIPFTDALAERAAEEFRRLGQPRKRAADVAIGVIARETSATLLTRNVKDFADIEALVVQAARSDK